MDSPSIRVAIHQNLRTLRKFLARIIYRPLRSRRASPSAEIAEDAEKHMFATDADRWTQMKCKEFYFELSVSI